MKTIIQFTLLAVAGFCIMKGLLLIHPGLGTVFVGLGLVALVIIHD